MRKGIILGVGTLALAAVFAVLLLMPAKPKAGPWKLSDGSEFSLVGVTHGKTHTMRYGNRPIDHLYPILPNVLRKKFGCEVQTLALNDSNSVVLWFKQDAAKGPASAHYGSFATQMMPIRVATVDAAGNEWPYSGLDVGMLRGATNILHPVPLSDFPRRSKEIGIRIYELRGGHDAPIAEYKIRNPTRTNYPVWKADPVPTTVNTNGLEVSLLALETGRAVFVITENKWLSDRWMIGRVLASSGAGQGYEADAEIGDANVGYRPAIIADFRGMLWPEEPAWKLNAQIWRTTNYPAAELWTVKGIMIPAEGLSQKINLKTNIYGSELELIEIRTPSARRWPIISTGRGGTAAPNLLWRVIEARDELGRLVESFGTGDMPRNGFQFKASAGARQLDITFACTKCLTVEFMARSVPIKTGANRD